MKSLNKRPVTISLLFASLALISLSIISCSGDNKTSEAVKKPENIAAKVIETTKPVVEKTESHVAMNDASKTNPQDDILAHGEKAHKNHCYKCHTDSVYTREDRFVKSIDALSKQVLRCKEGNDVPWFDEDTDAVVEFLNQKYYRF